jgi:hypothetical protein
MARRYLTGLVEPCGALPRKCLFIHLEVQKKPRLGTTQQTLLSPSSHKFSKCHVVGRRNEDRKRRGTDAGRAKEEVRRTDEGTKDAAESFRDSGLSEGLKESEALGEALILRRIQRR